MPRRSRECGRVCSYPPRTPSEHVHRACLCALRGSVTTVEKISMAEALRAAMRLAMRRDPSVFLLGEDIGIAGGFGGGFTVTLGLSEEFGHERVMDTPISEIAIIGAAVGAALVGMRPV